MISDMQSFPESGVPLLRDSSGRGLINSVKTPLTTVSGKNAIALGSYGDIRIGPPDGYGTEGKITSSGINSFAGGFSTGTYSAYFGVYYHQDITASGNGSFAWGSPDEAVGVIASGQGSVVLGNGTASGLNAFATGAGTASGAKSAAFANGVASAGTSVALGGTASGDSSVSMGVGAVAAGSGAIALTGAAYGGGSSAIGASSVAMGSNAVATGFQTLATGQYSIGLGDLGIVSEASTISASKRLDVIDANTLGSEKITNGSFTGSASSWTLGTGWAYASNRAEKNADGTGTLSQTSAAMVTPLVVGEMYVLQWGGLPTVGTYTISVGGVTFTAKTTTNPSGVLREVFRATSTADLVITPSNTGRVNIDNISLKKITGGTFNSAGSVSTPLVTPLVSDAGTLGSTTKQWSDLFLADGAVVNFNNGNYTLTHSAGALTTSGSVNIQSSLQCDSIVNDTGLAHGTYTPTLTGVANVSSSTARLATYMRVGNTVTVAGQMDITPTSNNTQTRIRISLPVASNFSTAYQVGGTASTIPNSAATAHVGGIIADATNDDAEMDYYETNGVVDTFSYTFTYQVI